MKKNHSQKKEEAKKSGDQVSPEASSADKAGTSEKSSKSNSEKDSGKTVVKAGGKSSSGKGSKSGKKSSASSKKKGAKREEVKASEKPEKVELEEVDSSSKTKPSYAVGSEKMEDKVPVLKEEKVVEKVESPSADSAPPSKKVSKKASAASKNVKKKPVAKPLTHREVVFWYNMQFTFLGTYSSAGFLDSLKLEIRPKKKKLLQAFELVDNELDVELEWGDATVQKMEGQLKAVAVGGGRVGIFGMVSWEKEGQLQERKKIGFWTSVPFQLTSAD